MCVIRFRNNSFRFRGMLFNNIYAFLRSFLKTKFPIGNIVRLTQMKCPSGIELMELDGDDTIKKSSYRNKNPTNFGNFHF